MYSVDRAGTVIKINDEGTRWERPTSGRRVRANRRNGPQSQGPTSEPGKRRSSQNAVKHGVLASGLTPIERGPFAEDADTFWERVSLVVEALDPSDPLEERFAREVASGLLRLDRLDLVETAAYESAARIAADLRSHLDRVAALDELAARARGLYYYLIEASNPEEVPYRDYAALMRDMGPKPGIPIKGFWDDEHCPISNEEWEKAFRFLLKKLWPNQMAAAAWAFEVMQRLEAEWAALEGREREIVADRVLDGAFDKVTRYHGRVMNGIARSLETLRTLKYMKQEGAGSNEPKSDEE